ncbi:hypothetical protein [Halioxenophilus aromaticivorans]|uniref:hypothetical protein n=1 Tax=Halioxenophilus aromaticivorans TaxID=1306992 RepID=UPI0031EB92BD
MTHVQALDERAEYWPNDGGKQTDIERKFKAKKIAVLLINTAIFLQLLTLAFER